MPITSSVGLSYPPGVEYDEATTVKEQRKVLICTTGSAFEKCIQVRELG